MLTDNEQKQTVARFAIDSLINENLLHSNMKIGLGTGSTACKAIEEISLHIKSGKLKNIIAVSTSFQTTLLCETLNIPVYSLNSQRIGGKLDFTIDGADEIDYDSNLTKGGGAALLLEKILAYNSERYYIICTEKKQVHHLGITFPLPIEIIPEARTSIISELALLDAKASLREGIKKMGPIVTDNGNFILDAVFSKPVSPPVIEETLKQIPGVVEVGFFTKKKPRIFLTNEQGMCSSR